MINGTIYVITNLNNNKKYVGLTIKTAEQRFEEHISNSSKGMNTILCKAIRKHGRENFIVEVLETKIDNAEELKEREKYWIKELDTYSFTGGHGYNMTIGGDGALGYIHSEEARKKMSESQSGANNSMYGRAGENNPMWGRAGELSPMYGKENKWGKHSEESKKKMSEALSGEKHPRYGKGKAVIIIFPDGSKKEFGTVKEASLYLGGMTGNCATGNGIRGLLKGIDRKRGRWLGYKAMYKEDIEEETI